MRRRHFSVCRDETIAVFRRIRNRLSFAVGRVACARLLPQAKSHRRALTQPALRCLNDCAGAHTPRRGRRPRRPGGIHPVDRQSWANPLCASCLPLGEGFAQPPRRAATRGPPHSGGKPAGHRSPPYIHPDSNISLRTFVCRDIIIAGFRRIRNRLSFAVGRVACARLLPLASSHRRALTQPVLRPLNECAGANT